MKDKNLFETLGELLDQNIDPNARSDEIWKRYGQHRAVMMLDSSGFSRVSEQLGIIHFLTRLVLMRIFPLRVSESGWVALTLNLNKQLGLTDSGDYKVNRWQFTTDGSQLEDMETLASSLATLKSYCEKNS
jgi:hypothetical protein|tara:strand:- start:1665 stop:2057 length:393 start_codon:yes stop_codon:yes gene_type:complete